VPIIEFKAPRFKKPPKLKPAPREKPGTRGWSPKPGDAEPKPKPKTKVSLSVRADGTITAAGVVDGAFLSPVDVTQECIDAVKRVHAEGVKRDAVVKDPKSGEPLGVMVFVPNAGVMKVWEHACALADRYLEEYHGAPTSFQRLVHSTEDYFEDLVEACQRARGREVAKKGK